MVMYVVKLMKRRRKKGTNRIKVLKKVEIEEATFVFNIKWCNFVNVEKKAKDIYNRVSLSLYLI